MIMDELRNYSEEVDNKMQKVIDEVTKEVLNNLENNPVIPKKTGEYSKSFYKRKLAQGKGYKRNLIASKKYQLTHLLENGHLTRSGTRTRAFPHWKQAQEIADTLPDRLKEVIKH